MAFQLYDLQVESTDHKLALLVFKNSGGESSILQVDTLSIAGSDASSFSFPSLATAGLDADTGTDAATLITATDVDDLSCNIVTDGAGTYLDIPSADQATVGYDKIYLLDDTQMLAQDITGLGDVIGSGYATLIMYDPEVKFGASSAGLTIDTNAGIGQTYTLTGTSTGDASFEWALNGGAANSYTIDTLPLGIANTTHEIGLQLDTPAEQPTGISFVVTQATASTAANGTVSGGSGITVSAGSPCILTYTPVATTVGAHVNRITAQLELPTSWATAFDVTHSFDTLFNSDGVTSSTVNNFSQIERNSSTAVEVLVDYTAFPAYAIKYITAVPFGVFADGGIFTTLSNGDFTITGWGTSAGATHTSSLDLSSTGNIYVEVTFAPTDYVTSPATKSGTASLAHNDINYIDAITKFTGNFSAVYNPIATRVEATTDTGSDCGVMLDPGGSSTTLISELSAANVKTIAIQNVGDLDGALTDVFFAADADGNELPGSLTNAPEAPVSPVDAQQAIVDQLIIDLAAATDAHNEVLTDSLAHELAVQSALLETLQGARTEQTSLGTYDEDTSWGFYLVDSNTANATVTNTPIASGMNVTLTANRDNEIEVATSDYYLVFWAVPDASHQSIEGDYSKTITIRSTKSDDTVIDLTHTITIHASGVLPVLSLQDLDGEAMSSIAFGTVSF